MKSKSTGKTLKCKKSGCRAWSMGSSAYCFHHKGGKGATKKATTKKTVKKKKPAAKKAAAKKPTAKRKPAKRKVAKRRNPSCRTCGK